jgi:hypothetical protein
MPKAGELLGENPAASEWGKGGFALKLPMKELGNHERKILH